MDNSFSERLRSKSVQNSIVNNISRDFNLTPILAEAYFHQIKDYFLQHADMKLSSGEVHYLAIDDRESAGKPVSLCKKISVHLTLHNAEEDLEICKQTLCDYISETKFIRQMVIL